MLSVQGPGFEWPIFERWDVPWEGQTVVLTMIACGIRCFSSTLETLVPLIFFFFVLMECAIFSSTVTYNGSFVSHSHSTAIPGIYAVYSGISRKGVFFFPQ